MIAIANYGLGNLKAISNIFNRLDIRHRIASTAEEMATADKIILPGVGSFDYAMAKLNGSGLRDQIDELVLIKKKAILGICVGMQLLAETSEEGQSKGLGWIPGHVKKLRLSAAEGVGSLPVPHMGWNSIEVLKANPLTTGLNSHQRFYFLHSYYFECTNDEHVLAVAQYGIRYPCLVQRENIFGIQCHPEKSHSNGVALLKSFASH
jgi:imidazole glycerol-phosphate synthase subunit HisH